MQVPFRTVLYSKSRPKSGRQRKLKTNQNVSKNPTVMIWSCYTLYKKTLSVQICEKVNWKSNCLFFCCVLRYFWKQKRMEQISYKNCPKPCVINLRLNRDKKNKKKTIDIFLSFSTPVAFLQRITLAANQITAWAILFSSLPGNEQALWQHSVDSFCVELIFNSKKYFLAHDV